MSNVADTLDPVPPSPVLCHLPECGRPAKYRLKRLCNRHYLRWWWHGTFDLAKPRPTAEVLAERIVVDRESGCWRWTGPVSSEGYARIGKLYAHRLAHEAWIGPIPAGADVDHTCHNADRSCPGGRSCTHRRCLNPAHLDATSRRQNFLRGQHPTAQAHRALHGGDVTPDAAT